MTQSVAITLKAQHVVIFMLTTFNVVPAAIIHRL